LKRIAHAGDFRQSESSSNEQVDGKDPVIVPKHQRPFERFLPSWDSGSLTSADSWVQDLTRSKEEQHSNAWPSRPHRRRTVQVRPSSLERFLTNCVGTGVRLGSSAASARRQFPNDCSVQGLHDEDEADDSEQDFEPTSAEDRHRKCFRGMLPVLHCCRQGYGSFTHHNHEPRRRDGGCRRRDAAALGSGRGASAADVCCGLDSAFLLGAKISTG
jgi:hypothetical protein